MAAPETTFVDYLARNDISGAAAFIKDIKEPQFTEILQYAYNTPSLTHEQKQQIFDVILAAGESPNLNQQLMPPNGQPLIPPNGQPLIPPPNRNGQSGLPPGGLTRTGGRKFRKSKKTQKKRKLTRRR